MCNDIPEIIENIKKLAEERPLRKCIKCGEEISYYQDSFLCEICFEIKITQEAEEKYRDRVENIEMYLKTIGIGRRYLTCSFESFKGGEIYVNECKKFLHNGKSNGKSLFITGAYGCGKTHLAVAICRELLKLKTHPSIIFKTGAELLLDIRKSFGNDNTSEDEVVSTYTNPDVLVIDDLGAEKATDWARTTLYVIIDRRDREMLPTIITSNLSLMEIKDILGGRIASRIANSRIIKMNMKDYRRIRENDNNSRTTK